jgi:hypothetical protein
LHSGTKRPKKMQTKKPKSLSYPVSYFMQL